MLALTATEARQIRARLFVSILEKLNPRSLLDVGGTVEYWSEIGFDLRSIPRVVILNTFEQSAFGIDTVVGDARDLARYRDGEFDLVFSNSVIGHVGGFSDQLRMAREIRRVGRHYFVQTPNHGFPLDWRTLVPFFHWLPVETRTWCYAHFRVGTWPKAKSVEQARQRALAVRNIRAGELPTLFPDGQVVRERFAGLTKSFMVHNGPRI